MAVCAKNLLHRFTVGPDAARVAIVTYSTAANADVNHVSAADAHMTDKCDLYRRISDSLENIRPENHAATGDALGLVYELLLDSRPTTKKAVFLITDGRLAKTSSLSEPRLSEGCIYPSATIGLSADCNRDRDLS